MDETTNDTPPPEGLAAAGGPPAAARSSTEPTPESPAVEPWGTYPPKARFLPLMQPPPPEES